MSAIESACVAPLGQAAHGVFRVRKVRITRRALLGGGAVLAGAAAVDGLLVEPDWLQVTYHRVVSQAVWPGIEGTRIAQLTDVHIGDTLGKVQEETVKAVHAVRPQIVLITGDMVEKPSQLPQLTEMTAALVRTGATVYATYGNWEHWGYIDRAALSKAYEQAGAQLLVDQNVLTQGVALAGTNDALTRQINWRDTVHGLRNREPTLLMTHSPFVMDNAPDFVPPFDLVLAGHTHGGQVRLPGWAPFTPEGSGRFVSGAYKTPLGAAYVSRGIGTTLMPVRLLCRPELAVFELSRA